MPIVRTRNIILSLLLAAIGGALNPAAADIVPHTNLPGSTWKHFDVPLDLTGYQNTAVSFSFASLMRADPNGFKLVTATGLSFLDDYHLASQPPDHHRQWERGPGGGRLIKTAMFNLAAYDGQSVILTINFNKRSAALRRGVVNLKNLNITVIPTSTAAAVVPEPPTMFLIGMVILGLAYTSHRRRKAVIPT